VLSRLWRTSSLFCPAVSLTQKELQRVLEKLISKRTSPGGEHYFSRHGEESLTAFGFIYLILRVQLLAFSVQKDRGLFKAGESHAAFLFIAVQLIYCFTDMTTVSGQDCQTASTRSACAWGKHWIGKKAEIAQ